MAYVPKYKYFNVITYKIDKEREYEECKYERMKYKEALSKYKALRSQEKDYISKIVMVAIDNNDFIVEKFSSQCKKLGDIKSQQYDIKGKRSQDYSEVKIVPVESVPVRNEDISADKKECFSESKGKSLDERVLNSAIGDTNLSGNDIISRYSDDIACLDKISVADIPVEYIIKMVYQATELLHRKQSSLVDVLGVADKEINCLVHELEDLNNQKALGEDEVNLKILDIGNRIVSVSKSRRDVKYSVQSCQQAIVRIKKDSKIDEQYVRSLSSRGEFVYDKHASKLNVYSYNYCSIEERDVLLRELALKYSRVVDVGGGIIKTYNNIATQQGSACKTPFKDKGSTGKRSNYSKKMLGCIMQRAIEPGEYGECKTVSVNDRIPREIGSNVRMVGVTEKQLRFLKPLAEKYKKAILDKDKGEIFLIERL